MAEREPSHGEAQEKSTGMGGRGSHTGKGPSRWYRVRQAAAVGGGQGTWSAGCDCGRWEVGIRAGILEALELQVRGVAEASPAGLASSYPPPRAPFLG